MRPLPSEPLVVERGGLGEGAPTGPCLMEGGRSQASLEENYTAPEPQVTIPVPAGSKQWRLSWTHAGPGFELWKPSCWRSWRRN